MLIEYETYLDKIHGGWLGKCIGGTIGARFEGRKHWIEVGPGELFPDTVPPNDDLDIPVLWLKVLEEKGPHLQPEDLADAWLEYCWYPFCEYGNFRRNWRLGIQPPMSGKYNNAFYDTGMGCIIRSEIWGYSFPGAPDLAARFAELDGGLDHGPEAIAMEQMFAAMSAMAFTISDIRRLIEICLHFMPRKYPLRRLIDAVMEAHDQGLSLREARDRYLLLGAKPEACDTYANIPIIFLALLYGENDFEATMRAGLACAYDVDSTLATTGAFLGQILGARNIPAAMREPVGDELIMGIDYHRPEMTLSALARDNARMGILLGHACASGVEITGAPVVDPLPESARAPEVIYQIRYRGTPCAAPGDTLEVDVSVKGKVPDDAVLTLKGPAGWAIAPGETALSGGCRDRRFSLRAPDGISEWPMSHRFTLSVAGMGPEGKKEFGVAGAGMYRLLGVFFDAWTEEAKERGFFRCINHHYASLDRDYLPEPNLDIDRLHAEFSRLLGRPALLPSYAYEVAPERLIGLEGAWCAYCARTIISDRDQPATLTIGHTNPFRIYLNGELVGERREHLMWAPWNSFFEVGLKKGNNTLLLKLIREGVDFKFTLGLKSHRNPRQELGIHCKDWFHDLSDGV